MPRKRAGPAFGAGMGLVSWFWEGKRNSSGDGLCRRESGEIPRVSEIALPHSCWTRRCLLVLTRCDTSAPNHRRLR